MSEKLTKEEVTFSIGKVKNSDHILSVKPVTCDWCGMRLCGYGTWVWLGLNFCNQKCRDHYEEINGKKIIKGNLTRRGTWL